MTPLELELVDLGEHLDVPPFAFRPPAARSEARAPAWLKVAAAVLLALALVLAISPTRRAIARWLGLGAVEIRTVPTTLPIGVADSTVPGGAGGGGGTSGGTSGGIELASARALLGFEALLPPAAMGPPERVDVDQRAPGGILALTYRDFTLVELTTSPSAVPAIGKLAPPGTSITFTDVNGSSAVWIEGSHQIALLGPDGVVRTDTVRRAGNVLLWQVGRVTLRLEGVASLDDARRLAATIR